MSKIFKMMLFENDGLSYTRVISFTLFLYQASIAILATIYCQFFTFFAYRVL